MFAEHLQPGNNDKRTCEKMGKIKVLTCSRRMISMGESGWP